MGQLSGVLTGLAVIVFAIFVGWLLATIGIVKAEDRITLNKVSFFAASPALLFTVIANANLADIFSGALWAHTAGVVIVGALVFAGMWIFGERDPARLVVGSYSGVYANANNIGLPIAVYVIGSGHHVAPLLVLQLVFMAPILMGILDAIRTGRVNLVSVLKQPFVNPIVLGSAMGVVWSAFDIAQPDWLFLPLKLVGGAAVPLMLIAFGISLRGQKPLQAGTGRKSVLIATVAKSFVLPIVVYSLGRWVFQLEHDALFAATVLAGLPTAQNMFQYALRYDSGEILARDVIFLTTVLTLPVTLATGILLRP